MLPRAWGLSIANTLRDTALRPVVAIEARAAQDHKARFGYLALQHRNDSLAVLVQQQQALRRENENLRGLVGVRARLVHPAVAAEVLHRPTLTDTRLLLLDVGRDRGVQPFDPVVTAEGLVGYIASVGPTTSNALTWDNTDFAAAATTVDGHVRGFVRPSQRFGRGAASLDLQGIAMLDSLPAGTTVITSGSGGTFPPGIPIGKVVAVDREVFGYDRIFRVVPFADPGQATHVMVLTTPRDSVYPAALPPPAPRPVAPSGSTTVAPADTPSVKHP
jgi:rod shape-determining protein MreC